ncbi:PilW family protein [Alkalibacillus haloalkaliphilus]|uniref:PilW family protein n=1 Tax=Alkalibacillus haloalkaliphilus TaxID=94136 RepID=UPI002936042F|nr:prepilin-type N-terminal cleavage/methylation domain-containing protein [Alkalibacillus haloalkaliphilus]MDV2581855.1 prepilin-type N-terminal cleavage/methylation domain-containing protein [Alkalibacillus haloalkaliphilus]
MNNSKGITLIELLGAIVLTFIVGSLVFSILIQSIENYQQSELRSKAQTDANRLIYNLTNIHQSSQAYTIEQSTESSLIVTIERDETTTYEFNGHPFKYELTIDGSNVSISEPIALNFQEKPSYSLSVTVTQPENTRFNPLEITTNISRVTPAGSGENE